MEVVLSGTGGPAGWPEPGCRCASCAPARADGRSREPAGLRLDGEPLPKDAARAGDRFRLGAHTVALHTGPVPDQPAFTVTSGDGGRLLYAPCGITRDALTDPAIGCFDLVVLGPGPDGIRSVARTLAAARASAAVGDHTDVVVVGLGHDDPPVEALEPLLAAWGARVAPDGTALTVNPGPAASRPSRSRLTGRTLVLGGARSGKSAYAEDLLSAEPHVTYLATGGSRPEDAEWVARVDAHRRRRPAHWATVESTEAAAVLATATGPVLLDCLGTWLTARMDHHGAWQAPGALAAVQADIVELLAGWRALAVPAVAVSNEVGSGVVPPTASGRVFRDLLGHLNTRIAAQSERVLLTVAGLTVTLRGPERERRGGEGRLP